MTPLLRRTFVMVAAAAAITAAGAAEPKLRVLVLSGANNHDWKQTTPIIKTTLEDTGRFSVDVEEKVATLKPQSLDPYGVILSDFNTFGQDPSVQVWDAAMKKAFIDHLRKGHGLVIVHAGSSGFYDWPEFQKIACGSWQAATSHGPIQVDRIHFTDVQSPITAGLQSFWIRDEFWKDVGVAPGVAALAYVSSLTTPTKDGGKTARILFTTEVGGARGFAMFLGHDTTAMKNTAWRTLLQRGTEWAATGKVTIPPAKDWPATKEDAERMTK